MVHSSICIARQLHHTAINYSKLCCANAELFVDEPTWIITNVFAPHGLQDPSPYHGESGHDRQQWSMFWADNYTSSDYVGFVDTDTLFDTLVDLA